jgi:hypothetical protein
LCDTNGINGIGGRNNDFSTGWVGGPIQYGSALSDSYHHHILAGTIAGINGVNSGFDGNDDIQTGWAFNRDRPMLHPKLQLDPSYFLYS